MMLATAGIILLGGLAFMGAEWDNLEGTWGERLGHSVWWAIVTLITIGYGDFYPKTGLGRVVAMGVGFSGVVILSLITAGLASVLVERRILEERGLQEIKSRGHRVVCGWNEHAEEVLAGIALEDPGSTVVVLSQVAPEDFADVRYRFQDRLDLKLIHGDFTQESSLSMAGIQRASACVVLVDRSGDQPLEKSDERVILATLAIKSLNSAIRLCVELIDASNEPHVRRARADHVYAWGRSSGFFLSRALTAPGLLAVMGELLASDSSVRLARLPLPRALVGRTFREAAEAMRESHGCILLGVMQEESPINVESLLSDDLSAIDQFIRRKFEESGIDLKAAVSSSRPHLNPRADYTLSPRDSVIALVGNPEAEAP